MKWINADTIVHWQSYDDEFEDFHEHTTTIAEYLDAMTDEGCPEGVDAVQAAPGTWKAVTEDGEEYKRICSCCGNEAPFDEIERVYLLYPHCPWCGASMGGCIGMKREFKTDFLRTLGELIDGCIERDTNTVELHFETSGIRWSVEMIFKLEEDGDHHE